LRYCNSTLCLPLLISTLQYGYRLPFVVFTLCTSVTTINCLVYIGVLNKFCGSQLPPIFEWFHISYHLTCLTTYQCNHNIVNLILLVVPQPHLVFSRGRSVPSLGLALLHFQPCQLLVKQLDLVCLTRAIPTVVGLLRPLVPLGRPSIGKGYPQYVTSPLNPRSFSTYLWASPGHSFH